MPDLQAKACSDCQETLPLDQYNRSAKSPDGVARHCKSCAAIRRARYQETNGIRWRAMRVCQRMGITPCQLTIMRIAQRDRCLLCGEKSDRGPLPVDHDHSCCPGDRSCGKCVRGLLCNNCNTALGLFKDSIPRLLAAVQYLGGAQSKPKEQAPSRIGMVAAGIATP